MKKKIDTRSPAKKVKDAIYAALPPVLIVRPLRYIRANTTKSSPLRSTANFWARIGYGRGIQGLARSI